MFPAGPGAIVQDWYAWVLLLDLHLLETPHLLSAQLDLGLVLPGFCWQLQYALVF